MIDWKQIRFAFGIGMLGAVFFGWLLVCSKVARPERSQRALNTAYNIVIAFQSYSVEYGQYPCPESDIDWSGDSSHEYFLTLLDPRSETNADKIYFFEDVPAKKGERLHSGIVYEDERPISLVDPWGSLYQIVVDANDDGSIENPDPDAKQRVLSAQVLVYSAGKDRDPDTWKDNIRSWR